MSGSTALDLEILDEYRREFEEPYKHVVSHMREQLAVDPTGREAKSTAAIIEKLRRETIRLSQIQDIAGCRVVVPDITEQDNLVSKILQLFPTSTQIDRRKTPSHGYRAVHLLAPSHGKVVEIQVRTILQQQWSEISELTSDIVDSGLKYGQGPEDFQAALLTLSASVAQIEEIEARVRLLLDAVQANTLREEVRRLRDALTADLNDRIDGLRRLSRGEVHEE